MAKPEWINIRICPTTPCINTQLRKNYFDSNRIQKGNATLLSHFPKDYFAADVDRSKYLHATSSKALFCTHYVGNVIYHKFSHDDVYIRFTGENLNIMLEWNLAVSTSYPHILFVKKYFFCIKLLHAHLQYVCNISSKCWKDPVKALRGVDFTKYALSTIIY